MSKVYELINTVDEDCNERYFFLNLKEAQEFTKNNNEFGIFERDITELSDVIREELE